MISKKLLDDWERISHDMKQLFRDLDTLFNDITEEKKDEKMANG